MAWEVGRMSKGTSRRQFMGRVAAMGAAGAAGCATREPGRRQVAKAAPETSSPKPVPKRRTLGPKDRIRCGFIGVGNRGSSLLNDTLRIENVDVVAVCDTYDVWRDRAITWCKKKYPEVASYVHFEEMLETEKLDAIVTATPDHIHAPVITHALDQGLDVYTEKPMTLAWQDAAAIAARVAETGAVLQVGTQLRSMPIYQRVRELAQSGELGPLAMVQVNRHMDASPMNPENTPNEATEENTHWKLFLRDTKRYPYDPLRYFSWRQFVEYSNGYFGDLMLHHLDICHFITGAGMPASIIASGGIYYLDDGRSCPDTVSALLEYPEEKFLFNYATTAANGHYGLIERYLFGEGTVEIRNMTEGSVFRDGVEQPLPTSKILNGPHLQNFFDCMRSRQKTIAPIEAAFMGASCTHLAYASMETGQAMHWDHSQNAPATS